MVAMMHASGAACTPRCASARRRGGGALDRVGGEREPAAQPFGVAEARVDHQQGERKRSEEKQPD